MKPLASKNLTIVLSAFIFLVAINLRPAMTGVGPIIQHIGADYGFNETVLGVLGAVPLLAFAVFSPLVHMLTRHVDIERSILLALMFLALGSIIRSYTGPIGLWFGTLLIGITMTIGNVLVPVLIKNDYPKHISGATAIYSACISLGSMFASIIAVPLANAIDWEFSLAFWAIPALLVSALWWFRIRHNSRHAPEELPDIPLTASVWKQPLAWLITLFMGIQAANFYIFATWLPTIEMFFGASEELASFRLFLFMLATVVGGLAISQLLNRTKDQVLAALVASIPMIIAATGMLVAPNLNMLWVILAGFSSGTSLVVALALIAMRGRSRQETTQLSGMAQSIGYFIAGLGPAVAGYIAEQARNWVSPIFFILGIAVVQTFIGIWAGKERKETVS